LRRTSANYADHSDDYAVDTSYNASDERPVNYSYDRTVDCADNNSHYRTDNRKFADSSHYRADDCAFHDSYKRVFDAASYNKLVDCSYNSYDCAYNRVDNSYDCADCELQSL